MEEKAVACGWTSARALWRHFQFAYRLVVIILLVGLRYAGAQVATQQPETLLTGSNLKADDLILTADAIYVGKILKLGEQAPANATLPSTGTTVRGCQVQLVQFLRCGIYDQMAVTMVVDFGRHESIPQAGGTYVFFVTKDNTRPTSSLTMPYTAIKLLAATDENIAEIKRLVALPVNQHQLSGSMLKLPEAAKSDVTFIAQITKLGFPDADSSGETGYGGTEAKVLQVLRGSIDSPVVLDIHVLYIPHEEPPRVGRSYIFFANKVPGYTEVRKILPLTDEDVAKVKEVLPPVEDSKDPDWFFENDLPAQTALVKSDSIFVGEITKFGAKDDSDSFSYAYPGDHLSGVKIKVVRFCAARWGSPLRSLCS